MEIVPPAIDRPVTTTWKDWFNQSTTVKTTQHRRAIPFPLRQSEASRVPHDHAVVVREPAEATRAGVDDEMAGREAEDENGAER